MGSFDWILESSVVIIHNINHKVLREKGVPFSYYVIHLNITSRFTRAMSEVLHTDLFCAIRYLGVRKNDALLSRPKMKMQLWLISS